MHRANIAKEVVQTKGKVGELTRPDLKRHCKVVVVKVA